jgi:hypothetical protein
MSFGAMSVVLFAELHANRAARRSVSRAAVVQAPSLVKGDPQYASLTRNP